MYISTISSFFLTVLCNGLYYSQVTELTSGDTIHIENKTGPDRNFISALTGGLNAIYQTENTHGSIDLSVMTYRFYLITKKRYKNDSIHQLKIDQKSPVKDIYKGFEFLVLNRAAVNFDSIQMIANDYMTSLQSSPMTVRLNKEIFLSQNRSISHSNYAPVISIQLTGDARAVPYNNKTNSISVGASGHFYFTFSTVFKRFELNSVGKVMDHGTMYFRPSVGIAYGSKELMSSLFYNRSVYPLLSSECRLGFKSDEHKVKDCSLLIRYTLSDVIGPRIRAGVLLSAIN